MISDERLRVRALVALGAFAPPLASLALESGVVSREPSRSWEGSEGEVHGSRVTLGVPAELRASLAETPAALDALESALAVALAEEGGALTDLVVTTVAAPVARHPYR